MHTNHSSKSEHPQTITSANSQLKKTERQIESLKQVLITNCHKHTKGYSGSYRSDLLQIVGADFYRQHAFFLEFNSVKM